MQSKFFSFSASGRASARFAVTLLPALFYCSSASAQAPPVPPAFQAIYSSLDTYLVNFNATLNASPVSQYPTLATGNLKNADSNAGPQLVNAGVMPGIQLQLQELQAMGVKAIMVEVGFPMLYEPFLTGQGQSYQQFVAFYQQIGAMVHAAGLKLVVENDTLLTNDDQAGWDAAPFYATLDWAAYQQARAQTAVTIAQTMLPDYMVVLEEPTTEANNSGQNEANTVSGSVSLLSTILASVQHAGVSGMLVGAGTGTAQSNPSALSFIQQYVTLPLDFIDFHIYPINGDYLPIAVQIASTAAAAGLPVAMTEYWLWKIADDELPPALSIDEIRARDPFSFWAPLDAYFGQTMLNLAQHTRMLFSNPFNTELFAAYLTYDSSTENLTPTQINSEEGAQASQNMGEAIFTSTALSYYAALVSPPDTTPPTVPTQLAGSSNNPTTTSLTWNASTDNVGVAGYNVLRNGSIVGTTASLYYQDSGLTSSTTYTYTVEAFDLGGNISAPSLRVNVTTSDVTPPSTPANLAATAVSCQMVKLTWSASTDNEGVGSYLVFWGVSPAAMSQVGRTPATVTAYTSYPLTCGTTYYYGVEAVDTSGNVSPMSVIVSVTTPVAPSAPATVTAAAVSASTVSVTWFTAMGGGLPIQYYHVYRGSTASNLAQVAIVSQTSYSDNSVTSATTYYYAVQSADTGGDLSAMSIVVSATTPVPPGAPANLGVTPVSMAKVSLAWSPAASGGLPIQNYHVYRGTTPSNVTQLAIVLQTSYTDSSVAAGAAYYYAVEAADSGGDLSPMSAVAPVTVPVAPSTPADLQATPNSTTKVGLTWLPSSSGGLPIQNYRVYRGSTASTLVQVAVVLQCSYSDTSVTAGALYYYAVAAADSGGDLSPMSAVLPITVPVAPSAPPNLQVTPASSTKIGLTWSMASSGGLPVQNYHVYRGTTSSNLSQVAIVLQTSYSDTSVTAGAVYYYAVAAADSGGDLSPLSSIVPVTVPVGPSAPPALVATPVSTSKISLTWSVPASGGLPIQNYHVFRGATASNLSQIATVSQPAYTDATGSPATTYYYAVQASDTGGDLSPLSGPVSAATLALPSPPTNLAATAPNKVQVSLTWKTAQSGMPLVSYTIFRGSSPSTLSSLKTVSPTATSANDGSVASGVTYYYGMQSKDSGGNISPMSAVVSITTP